MSKQVETQLYFLTFSLFHSLPRTHTLCSFRIVFLFGVFFVFYVLICLGVYPCFCDVNEEDTVRFKSQMKAGQTDSKWAETVGSEDFLVAIFCQLKLFIHQHYSSFWLHTTNTTWIIPFPFWTGFPRFCWVWQEARKNFDNPSWLRCVCIHIRVARIVLGCIAVCIESLCVSWWDGVCSCCSAEMLPAHTATTVCVLTEALFKFAFLIIS